jgi:hypothetical protein
MAKRTHQNKDQKRLPHLPGIGWGLHDDIHLSKRQGRPLPPKNKVRLRGKTPEKGKKNIKTYHSLTRQSPTDPSQSWYLEGI